MSEDVASPTPFTGEDYRARTRRVAAAATEEGLTGVLVTPGPDLVWLTGYHPTAITERLTLLALRADGDPVLVVPALERHDAEVAEGVTGMEVIDWSDASDPYLAVASVLPAEGTYGISDSAWALHLLGLQQHLPRAAYRSLSDAMPMMRAVKGPEELKRLAAAGAAADAAYEEILGVRFRGRRETDVAGDLADLLRRFGHEQVDFTVVGSGPNGADPHHEAGNRVIERGDAVVLDFGGLRYGYGSDTTRTVCVGEPDDELRRVHEVVLRAQEAGVQAARAGATCQDVDRAARTLIAKAGYGEAFIHRTGHGIGVTTHEPPYMVEGEEQPLLSGMCFSVEPGTYLPGRFGVRIEDIVTVTDGEAARLNNTDHGLAVVA